MSLLYTTQYAENITNMKYYISQLPEEGQPTIYTEVQFEELQNYPDKLWWQSGDGVVLIMIPH